MPADNNQEGCRGFTLLEIALALGIMAMVSIYLLNMFDFVRMRKDTADDQQRMAEIIGRLQDYYLSREQLPEPVNQGLPVDALGLKQSYRFDHQGRFFLYFRAPSLHGYLVNNQPAAGVLISTGPDQLQDYQVDDPVNPTQFTAAGDDLVLPVFLDQQGITIALRELEVLSSRVEAYDRKFAGISNNGNTSIYGDESRGGLPIVDPDTYEALYAQYPQLYPYNPYYPTLTTAGPPPTWEDLIYSIPDAGWPAGCAYNNWPSRPPDPPADPDLPPNFNNWPSPGAFGEYPDPEYPVPPATIDQNLIEQSYNLVDLEGCTAVSGNNDPNCGRANLDAGPAGQELQNQLSSYGLGSRYLTDPWGHQYQWGRNLDVSDRRYHTFFSPGPDGLVHDPNNPTSQDDDITLF